MQAVWFESRPAGLSFVDNGSARPRTPPVDLAVGFEESAVVEPVDPFERGVLEVFEAAPGAAVADEFGLVQPDQRLGERIVIRVALRPDRVDRGGLGEPLGVPNRQVLDAAIRMMDEILERLAGLRASPDRLLQGIEGDVGAQRPRGLPIDDHP